MSLTEKIKKIIKVIEKTSIEEIEVSSFWGAQKIRLSKKSESSKVVVQQSSQPVVEKEVVLNEDIKKDESLVKEKQVEPSNDDIVEITSDSTTNLNIEEHLEYQKAPLVGTFYAASKPGEPPFIKVGDKVSKGQTLCIIEAMKIFNEIESDFNGTIVEVLAEDSNPVEFNQSIFSIKPNE
ncbi:MAG: acetyl-CoA carboxylase, biotin carboxyl carrier protein [Candidatus Marinimicrobia bacterium]|nr:acetyl-CoA carboxylase, biotin carboxyl carrier protein [Candidatus Neomarinimicrobiota bacterium]|tara:strand:- start:7166 stop:7705 length:540 start_codon:yes stop_codon:yes gene_type:complete